MNFGIKSKLLSNVSKIGSRFCIWNFGILGHTAVTQGIGGKCTLKLVWCDVARQSRSCSSDLKQRGLKSLIRRIDTREAESMNAEIFTARRVKPKSLVALQESDGPVETHLQGRNRNPRNMELLGYNKPRGYGKLYKRRDFWNRLNLVITNSHTTAYVDHHTGEILVSASTQEFCIARHLPSKTDVTAAINIGRVIAERCKESGIERVFWRMKQERRKEKVQAFMNAAKEEGLRLTEPRRTVLPHSFVSDPADFKRRKRKITHFCSRMKRKHTYK